MKLTKKCFTIKEVATALGVSTVTMYRYIKKGEIGCAKVGKARIIITLYDLIKYLGKERAMCIFGDAKVK